MREKFIKLTVALVSVGGFALTAPIVSAASNSNAGNHVTICHATGSGFVMISPDANGVINGHVGHQDARDIIPPFNYNDHGTAKSFPGQNWNAQGQATLANGCKVPAGGQGGGTGVTPQGGNTQTNGTGGQGGGVVAGANTAQSQSQVGETPTGGVGAGVGGATTVSLAALLGLTASVGSLGYGVRRLTK